MALHFIAPPTPQTTGSVVFASIMALIASLLTFPPAAHPQTVYKWVDDKGTVHYDENPPANNTPHESLDIPVDQIESKYETPPTFKYTPSNKKSKRSKRKNRRSSQQRIAQRCDDYSKKFAHYTSRLRAGYKAKQYNHLTEKRRYYRQLLRDHCKKIPR
jgi:hypothetical protein